MACMALWARRAAFLCAVLLTVTLVSADSTKYSPPVLNQSYASRNDYDDRGMQTLYNIARKVLRGVQKPEPLPPDLLYSDDDGVIQVNKSSTYADGPHLVSYYAGVVTMVALGLVLAVAMPCSGFLWCLCGSGCRCSSGKIHKRGNRKLHRQSQNGDVEMSRDEDREPGPCFVPAALGVTVCVIAVGSGLALATNAYMDTGVKGFPVHVTKGIDDVGLFADNSVLEVTTFLDTNYNELANALSDVLKDCKTTTNGIVSGITNVIPTDTINTIPDGLVSISMNLQRLQGMGEHIVTLSGEVVRVVTDVKNSISKKCQADACNNFIAGLVTTPLPSLPDVSGSISALQSFVDPDFKSSLQNGVQQLNKLEDQVRQIVDESIDTVNQNIQSAHSELQKTSSELTEKVLSVRRSMNEINDKVNDYSKYLEDYDAYRNGGFIVIGLVYMLIAVALAFGLVYGCCSKQNSYSILKLPVWLIFLASFVLTLFTVTAFLAGMVGDRICEAVNDPDNNQIINLFDEVISKTQHGAAAPGNISYYIRSCERDETLYNVLQLDNSEVKIDKILDIVQDFSFDEFLRKIAAEQSQLKNSILIPDNIKQELENLRKSAVANLDFEVMQNTIKDGKAIVDELKPTEWADNLETIASSAGVDLSDEVESLRGLDQTVTDMQTTDQDLATIISNLQEASRLGANSFSDALSSFLSRIQKADEHIRNVDIVPVANKTATDFKSEVTDYLNYVIRRIKTDALRCAPLHRVFYSIVVASCDEVLSPWNGLWAASGLCLLFFIPAAILAINLSSRRR